MNQSRSLIFLALGVVLVYAVNMLALMKSLTFVGQQLNEHKTFDAPNEPQDHAAVSDFNWLGVSSADFTIVQFDGRATWEMVHYSPKKMRVAPTKHNTAAIWNHLYAKRHGHSYIYYNFAGNETGSGCTSDEGQDLAAAWCKVRALKQAQIDFPTAKYFLYLDTDAVVDIRFQNQPLNQLLYNMTNVWLSGSWNIDERPFVFNQEGPSYWCRRIMTETNYTSCLNTGTMFWMRSAYSTLIIEQWWKSADDPYDSSNVLGIKFRRDTPWEQVQAERVLAGPLGRHIQVASFPNEKVQISGPCLSDCWLPPNFDQLGCFILHYCMKDGLVETYSRHILDYLSSHSVDKVCYNTATLSPRGRLRRNGIFHTAECRPEWIARDEFELDIAAN
mmetsp:Transcript_35043/g.83721  ORF Transcript_35043/g.83721 Transcript_35043/m.83721 type:complete len:388 (+) Transcript_35043:180-1343(+)